jgi:glutathione S-transferase
MSLQESRGTRGRIPDFSLDGQRHLDRGRSMVHRHAPCAAPIPKVAPMIRLYFHPASTFARRVRITLLEKQLAFESSIVDLAAGQHREPSYLKLNPYGRVPTLEEDGFVIYESAAILQYLEATHPAPPLTPSDPRGRALVDMHMRLCDSQMARPTGTIIFPKRFLPKERWDEKAMAQAKGEIEKHLSILEYQLGDRPYLVADRFTLADVCYAPFLQFLTLMEIAPSPAVAAWTDRILARPSAQQTIPPV